MSLRLSLDPWTAPPGVPRRVDAAGGGTWLVSGDGWALHVDAAGEARPSHPPPPRAERDEGETVVGECGVGEARWLLLADPDGYTLLRETGEEEEVVAAFSSEGAAALAPDGRVVVVHGDEVLLRGDGTILARVTPPVRALAIEGDALAVVDATGLLVVDWTRPAPAACVRRGLDLGTSFHLLHVRGEGDVAVAWGSEPALVRFESGEGMRRIALTSRARGAEVLPDGRVVVAHGERLDVITRDGTETLYRGSDLRLHGRVGDTLLVGHAPLDGDTVLLRVSLSGAPVLATRIREGRLAGVALAPDGRWLILTKSTGQAPLFDTKERKVMRVLAVDPRALSAPRFAPAGPGWLVWAAPGDTETYPTMLSGGPDDEGTPIVGPAGAGRFAFSPDGARLLATRIGERTWVVDVAERAARAVLPVSGAAVWDPAGRRFAGLAAGGGSLLVFDRDGQALAGIEIPVAWDLVWHGDSLLLATAAGLRLVRVA